MSKLSSRGSAWNKLRDSILKRDGYICTYCGQDATTADHIIPKDAGGEDTPDNLVAACIKCNGQKSNKIMHRNTWVNNNWLERV